MAQSMMRNAKRFATAGMAAGGLRFVRGIGRFVGCPGLMLLALCLVSLPAWGAEEGVVDKEITVKEAALKVSVRYPVLNMAAIDADILDWARQTAASFVSEFSETPRRHEYELKATYRIVRASPKVVSVVWDVWTFTGGAHGNLDIVAFIYDSDAGQPLELRDLFADEQGALNLLSSLTYARLPEMLGDMADEDMIKVGTSPDLDNFACVVPTPEGVRVFFQPYQVAAFAADLQEVEISLQELQDAGPRRAYWEVR
jgi:hypothetical protein